MPDFKKRSKVTIEDLLKFKRVERPAGAFWENFERELRQKQLTALIRKRSWWQELPQLLNRRVYLPAGVAALVAFMFIAAKYSVPTPVTVADSQARPTSSAASVALPNSLPMTPTSVAVNSSLGNRRDHDLLPVDDRVAIAAHGSYAATQSGLPLSGSVATRGELTPSARSIAANLARLEQVEPELVSAVIGNRLSSSIRPVEEEASVEFASLSNNIGRRSWLLAQYGERPLNPTPTAPEAVRERLTRRLSELDYGDRFSRIGLKGDQVSVRF